MLPRYSTFQRNSEQGGLNAPILKDILDSRLISIWIKLLSHDSLWARIEREIISSEVLSKRGITASETLKLTHTRTKGWPERWKPYLKAWFRLGG